MMSRQGPGSRRNPGCRRDMRRAHGLPTARAWHCDYCCQALSRPVVPPAAFACPHDRFLEKFSYFILMIIIRMYSASVLITVVSLPQG